MIKRKKTSAEADQNQLGLAFHIPMMLVPQGGGEFLLKQGKPVQWLTPVELAKVFGVDRDTVYRWRTEGDIPHSIKVKQGQEEMEIETWRPRGKRKLEFHAEVIPYLRAKFAKDR